MTSRKNAKRMSPILAACQGGHLHTAIRLLELGADVNDVDMMESVMEL